MNPTLKVAEEFKDVKFEHATGYKTGANVKHVQRPFLRRPLSRRHDRRPDDQVEHARYVAAFPIPEVLQGINAFAIGRSQRNPKAQVRVVWVNTWYDPARSATRPAR